MSAKFPSNGTMIRRALLKRCPVCGNRKLFHRWFGFPDRCPNCHFVFEREDGFFTGGWMINLAVTEGLLFFVLIGYIFAKGANGNASGTPFLIAALAVGLLLPLFTYPFSRTLWLATELILRPPSEEELRDVTL